MSVAEAIGLPNLGSAHDTLPFNDNHLKYLAKRAVPLDWAAYAGLRAVTAAEAAAAVGWESVPFGGMAVPYPNQDGYRRIRLDTPIEIEGKLVRWIAPRAPVPIYAPPNFQFVDFSPIIVVEGPVKALAVLDAGLNTLGLGGTGTTLTEKAGARVPNDSWSVVFLQGRTVVLLFDAWRMLNPAVARDEARLALALEHAGAVVQVAALPLQADGGDQGPDDFLAVRGPDELRKVIAAAVPADPVVRATMATTTGEAVALLADLPFLAAIKVRGVVAEERIATLLAAHKVSKSALRRAIKESEKKAQAGQARATGAVVKNHWYSEHEGGLALVTRPDGVTDHVEPVSNFVAQIVEEETLDDGAERKRVFAVEGTLACGTPLPRVRVTPKELAGTLWPIEKWGGQVTVNAGLQRASGHLCSAIQALSNPEGVATYPRTVTYQHTGWREHEGEHIFLHAGGVVGGSEVSVDLEGVLGRYKLPTVPEDSAEAVKLALSFLELADLRITAPLFCAAFRAPLQHALYCDSTIAVHGRTGAMKTTLVALLMSLFGDFDEEHLPGSWSATVNWLELLAFLAKDVLVVIDDFTPRASGMEDELQRKAERFLRAVGNANSRGRLRADLTARPDRPPRALMVSTGEDVPSGESIQARLVQIRMKPGDVDIAKLTALQLKRHRLPHAMLGYVLWLRGQMKNLRAPMERFVELRAELQQVGQHLRAPAAMAHLLLGMEYFCLYAADIGVLEDSEVKELLDKTREALAAGAAEQAQMGQAANPERRFIDVVGSLITTGAVAVALMGQDLSMAKSPGIGWRDKDYLYLLPDATYQAVVGAMRQAGQAMPLGQTTLWSRLVEAGYLLPGEGGRHTRQKRVVGGQKRLLWLPLVRLDGELEPAVADPGDAGRGQGQQLRLPDVDQIEAAVRGDL